LACAAGPIRPHTSHTYTVLGVAFSSKDRRTKRGHARC